MAVLMTAVKGCLVIRCYNSVLSAQQGVLRVMRRNVLIVMQDMKWIMVYAKVVIRIVILVPIGYATDVKLD